MEWHSDDTTGCPECSAVVNKRASYCPDCGAEIYAGKRAEENNSTADWNRGRGGPDADYIQEDGQQDRDQPQSRTYDGYAHLFGDVYWRKNPASGTVLYILAGVFLLVPAETFFLIFREPSQWLLTNHPEVFLWLTRNCGSLGFGFLTFALISHITLDPDPTK